jgi:hypothetical protein
MLDLLQEMAWEHADDPRKLFLIERLAEHVEEEEMTEEFLRWIAEMLRDDI